MRAMARTPTLVVLAAWLVCASAGGPAAQLLHTEDAYHALVTAYVSGDRDAVRRLQEWPTSRLVRVVTGIQVPGRLGWTADTIVAAVKLHTEAMLQPPVTGAAESVSTYLALASVLLGKAPSSTRAFASRWYVAIARVSCDSGCGTLAGDLLAAARRLLPGDAAVLCESGRLDEYRAGSLRNLGPVSVRDLTGIDETVTFQRMRSKREALLRRAAGWLRAGAEADPSDATCRLHLARVESLLGNDVGAEPLLRGLQQDRDDAVSYLASMFLGAASERRGAPAEAEASYRAAMARFPRGQAAHVALSAVLRHSGRVAEARETLARAVDGVADERRDAWWWYHLDPTSAVYARIEDLLKEGR
jgi:tetratricopeptide (TPR) repeat protein